jgi:hypothetical protein
MKYLISETSVMSRHQQYAHGPPPESLFERFVDLFERGSAVLSSLLEMVA